MLNVVMIAVVVLLAPRWGKALETQVFALAWGVLLAGVAQVLYQWPTLKREGFAYTWVNPWSDPTVRTVVARMIPGMIGVAAFQINMLSTQGIAWVVDKELNAAYNYAVRLMELPQGVFGISLATFLLPTLSGLAAEKKFPEFRSTVGQGLGYLAFTNVIAATLLFVLAEPIVRLLFQHGVKFTALSTIETSRVLLGLVPGLVAFSFVNILARAFYALNDTRTPMLISSVCLVLNILLAAFLIPTFKQLGMGVANTLSALVNVAFLFYALRRKLKFLDLTVLRQTTLPLLGAAALGGVLAWVTAHEWAARIGHDRTWQRLGEVFIPMSLGGGAYVGVLLLARNPQARDIVDLVTQKFRNRSKPNAG
jgi:putative peptidoglycan lipid II flippase